MRALGDLRRKPAVEAKKEEVTAPKVEAETKNTQTTDSTFDESVVIN